MCRKHFQLDKAVKRYFLVALLQLMPHHSLIGDPPTTERVFSYSTILSKVIFLQHMVPMFCSWAGCSQEAQSVKFP